MATIQYRTFRFNTPPILSEDIFNELKKKLNQNSNFRIKPNFNFTMEFVNTFKIDFILFGVGIAGGFIGLLGEENDIEWLMIIGYLLCFSLCFLGFIFSFIPSFFSYLGYLSVKSSYYRKLKKDIKKANNYKEFLKYQAPKKYSW